MFARWMLFALVTVALAADAPATEGAAVEEGAQYVEVRCTVCHGEELIHQQRLTEAQWRATVEKMVRWGAQVDAAVEETLVAYLSTHYGTDAGPFAPRRIETREARAAVDPRPDEAFAAGDAAQGKQLYDQHCMACHGPTAQGQIGINLVDRSVLYRAGDFAAMARKGRGLMPGQPIDDPGVANLLAYLRTLPR